MNVLRVGRMNQLNAKPMSNESKFSSYRYAAVAMVFVFHLQHKFDKNFEKIQNLTKIIRLFWLPN